MNLKNRSLKLRMLMTFVSLLLFAQAVHAAAREPYADFQEWIEEPGHNQYGSMGLLDLRRFERDAATLGQTHNEFYHNLTHRLMGNPEFVASAYLHEPKPPIKQGAVSGLIDHGFDISIHSLALYIAQQQVTATEECNDCFAIQGINSATASCGECYGDVITNTTGKAGVAIFGLAIAKSAIYFLKDVWDVCFARRRPSFEPSEL